MTKLEIDPFTLGDTEITEVVVKPLRFLEFVKATQGTTTIKDYQRSRMRASVTLNGNLISSEQISMLPIKVGKKIVEELNKIDDGNGPGEILSGDNDGINAPILYRLGTPLKMKRGKEDVFIKELEFQAKTFGDIEDIIASDHILVQAVELLKRLAVPVGVKGLTVLPENVLNQLSTADGAKIAQDVLTPFVE